MGTFVRWLASLVVLTVVLFIGQAFVEVKTTWYVDWRYLSDMLIGSGTFLIGFAACATLFAQWGYEKKSEEIQQRAETNHTELMDRLDRQQKTIDDQLELMELLVKRTGLTLEDAVKMSDGMILDTKTGEFHITANQASILRGVIKSTFGEASGTSTAKADSDFTTTERHTEGKSKKPREDSEK